MIEGVGGPGRGITSQEKGETLPEWVKRHSGAGLAMNIDQGRLERVELCKYMENHRGHGTGRRSRSRSELGGQQGSELPHGP